MLPIAEENIFQTKNDDDFAHLALEIFQYQAKENKIYNIFLEELQCDIKKVNKLQDIPFLPISLFKQSMIVCGDFEPETIFLSSGTSSPERSKHYIKSLKLYEKSFIHGFQYFYGEPDEYTIYALLPSYIENGESSLVYMVNKLIEANKHRKGGFFLNEYSQLLDLIRTSQSNGEKVMLIGVTYALLELAQKGKYNFDELIVVETGGMKGRGKELLRNEAHNIIKSSFNVNKVHSEYGMTELLSQAWSTGHGVFDAPPWMKIFVREPSQPGKYLPQGKTGGINIIDLANIHSCSFIETSDLGVIHNNGSFEVVGRFENSDLRGCNLLE